MLHFSSLIFTISKDTDNTPTGGRVGETDDLATRLEVYSSLLRFVCDILQMPDNRCIKVLQEMHPGCGNDHPARSRSAQKSLCYQLRDHSCGMPEGHSKYRLKIRSRYCECFTLPKNQFCQYKCFYLSQGQFVLLHEGLQ